MKTAFIATLLVASSLASSAETVSFSGRHYDLGENTLLLTDRNSTSPYVFNDALKALEAITASDAKSITLLVEPSVYWLDDPDDPAIRRNSSNSNSAPFAVEVACDTLSIIGLADNPEDVVFAVNRGQTQGALGNYTMIHFLGKSLQTENMTFGNYCNVDLVYPKDPSKNRAKRRDAIVQAQLGICQDTDRMFAKNCRFISRLNLCPFVGARRSLYKDCYFESTDDALSGSGVYLDCRFTFHSGKPFYSTASTGAIFLNCDIHSLTDGTQYLTKMPGAFTMIDTRFTSDDPNLKLRWTRDASPIRCYQSNVSLNGRKVTVDVDRPELWKDVTNLPILDAFKITTENAIIYNTLNLLAGDDGWDPLGQASTIKEIENSTGRKYTSLPVSLRVMTSSGNLDALGDSVLLTASARLWGDYPVEAPSSDMTWNAPSTISLIREDGKVKGVSTNRFPTQSDAVISASSPYGLSGATMLKIAPYLLPAPKFESTPEIKRTKNSLEVEYALDRKDELDNSYIIWYRSTLEDLSDSVAVYHGCGVAARQYNLTKGDSGHYLSASVFPRYNDTATGTGATASIGKINKAPTSPEAALYTSFAEIPIRTNEAGRKGFWHFDIYKPADTSLHDWKAQEGTGWYYGHGDDAATGIGLVQATKGARLSYTPARESSREMHLRIVAEPAKGPGQGFGSATGQYMDICVKFDPVTLTGYALRIERRPDYDKAVTFTLVRYEDGEVTPVSESVPSSCYRTPCHINIGLKGSLLTASATTDAPEVTAGNPEILPSVSLSANVLPTAGSSFAVQHTGSAGSSATLLRDLEVKWK
ncbi:MAG: hypothetical protein NC039_07660 [Muribaculaceae bacterium]|nr:hypothetical protein [Muribaculaceae bacterium]